MPYRCRLEAEAAHAGPRTDAALGVARTGVSVLVVAGDAFARVVPAGGAVLNGAGECTGFITAAEWGFLETPVFLTSTLQLGRVYDAACELMLEREPRVAEDFIIPVVAECDDSWLNDARRMQVSRADVAAAWEQALASRGGEKPPAEGSVGSGTGMGVPEADAGDVEDGVGRAGRQRTDPDSQVSSARHVGILPYAWHPDEGVDDAGHLVNRHAAPRAGRGDLGGCFDPGHGGR